MRALAGHGGAARREALLADGVTKHAIYAALANGLVAQPARGCFAVPDAPLWAVRAATFRGFPTCVTLLAMAGLPLLTGDSRAHIGVPRDRALRSTDARSTARMVLHRERDSLDPAAGVRGDEVRVALGHAARCLRPPEWLIPVDAALHRGVVTLDQVTEAGRVGRIDPAWTRRMADPQSESPAESRARVAMLEAGLNLRSQVSMEGIGRVDFVVEQRVIVETDGRDYHSDEAKFAEDKRRDREAIKRGFLPMRYPAAHALGDPESIAAEVQDLLAS